MELKDAIEISRIISKAPEERIPMILSVLEKADVTIGGMEELDEWRAFKDMNAIVDLDEFMAALEEKFSSRLDGGRYKIPTGDFGDFCKEHKLKPTPVRRWLAKKGIIETSKDGEKTNYTVPTTIDGKHLRCVLVNQDWRQRRIQEEGR